MYLLYYVLTLLRAYSYQDEDDWIAQMEQEMDEKLQSAAVQKDAEARELAVMHHAMHRVTHYVMHYVMHHVMHYALHLPGARARCNAPCHAPCNAPCHAPCHAPCNAPCNALCNALARRASLRNFGGPSRRGASLRSRHYT